MTTNELIRRIKRYKPVNKKEFQEITGLKFKHLGSGADRQAYQVGDTEVVVKIASDCHRTSQTYCEKRAYQRIKKLKKYARLRKYMPNIYYINPKLGVVVVKKYDKPIKKHAHAYLDFIEHVTKHSYGNDSDVCWDNVGVDKKGNFKILDLGCFDEI